MSGHAGCPACGNASLESMGSVGPVPVLCGSLWDSREEAIATPTASLDLVVCHRCAHVWNATFDPELVDYQANYDNALDFSLTFRDYTRDLVDHLVDRFDLRGRNVAEIGSGKGEFLRQLCARGGSRGIGYDPTYEGPDRQGDVEFVREFFAPGSAPGDVDFVCCRHVLEHVADPVRFLTEVRLAVGGRPVPMYFEVPNAEFNFAESGPWDLIYPHVGYFNEESLSLAMTRAGFRVLEIRPAFHHQFLAAEVIPDSRAAQAGGLPPPSLAVSMVQALQRQLFASDAWRGRLGELVRRGPVGLWGAGSKGVTFLSLVDPNCTIGSVVDANPRKWGRVLPASGLAVVAPAQAAGQRLQTVLVMNRAYMNEISGSLAKMGSKASVVPV